jgi:hypothetical protein
MLPSLVLCFMWVVICHKPSKNMLKTQGSQIAVEDRQTATLPP